MPQPDDKAPPSFDDLSNLLAGIDNGDREGVRLALSRMTIDELHALSVSCSEVLAHHRSLFNELYSELSLETGVRLAQAHAEGVL
ncbi:hypothetical protein [Rhodococcus koreensis]